MCRELSRCLYSLSSAGDAAGRNLITLFRTVNNFAHFFFRQVGVASRPSPVRTTRRTTTTRIAVRLHRRHDFRKPLFLRGLRKRIDATASSTTRSHRCVAVATATRKAGSRRPKKISDGALVSRRTNPICAKVRELRRGADVASTTIRRVREHRIGHVGDDLRDAVDALRRATRIAPDEPVDAVRRAPGTCRSSRRAGPPTRSIRCFRDCVRWVAHRTVTFCNAHRAPQKQNRPHEAAGR